MTNLTGQDIGPYHVEEEIGRGGMATVYRARQHNLGRDVAVKVLPAEMSHDATFLARFAREVKLIARLQHARILPVYDYGEFKGQPFIVMAYLPGGTLRDRLRAERMPLELVVQYVRQMAEGLDYLHEKGVIHRDFKPSNVLLDRTRQNSFLADFGIARFQEATAVTLTGQGLMGTPSYMAPEMYEKGQLSTAVDIYALGIALYEMFTGELPYKAESPVKYMYAHLYEPIPDVRQRRPDLPESIQRVIQTSLVKNKDYRYPTAGDLAHALERAASDPGGQPYHLDLLEPLAIHAPDAAAAAIFEAPTMDIGDIAGVSTPGTPEAISTPAQPVKRQRGQPPLWMMLGGLALVAILGAAAIAGIFVLPRLPGSPPATQAVDAVDVTPTSPPTGTAPPPAEAPAATSTTQPTATPLPLGGGSGWVALNAAARGYLVDANCVLAGLAGCDSAPQLLAISGSAASPGFGAWSPDGQRVAISDGGKLSIIQADGTGQVAVSDQPASQPAWSPAGDALAFIVGGDVWKADIACLDGGGGNCLTQLTDTYEEEFRPAWSPDGGLITFLQKQQASAYFMALAVSPAGGAPQALTPASVSASAVQWMPDSTRFLYISTLRVGGSTANTLFYEISLNLGSLAGGEPTRVVMLSKGDFGSNCAEIVCPGGGQFSLSADGGRAAITFATRSDEDMELYLLDLACLDAGAETCQSGLIQVTDNAFDDRNPAWSPDGRLVAFVRARSTNISYGLDEGGRNTGADVFALNAETLEGLSESAARQLTSLGFVDFDLLWWQPFP